jgi:uncharacterized protein YidB (DUF937 family)
LRAVSSRAIIDPEQTASDWRLPSKEAHMALRGIALALLGLLAYKNRDKIGDFLRRQTEPGSPDNPRGSGGLLGDLVSGSGVRDVLERLRNAGAGEQVDSWISRGENQPLQRDQVERAIDPETLDSLSQQTGLSRDELIERITKDLPEAVDQITPTGELPPDDNAARGPNLLDDVSAGNTRT